MKNSLEKRFKQKNLSSRLTIISRRVAYPWLTNHNTIARFIIQLLMHAIGFLSKRKQNVPKNPSWEQQEQAATSGQNDQDDQQPEEEKKSTTTKLTHIIFLFEFEKYYEKCE